MNLRSKLNSKFKTSAEASKALGKIQANEIKLDERLQAAKDKRDDLLLNGNPADSTISEIANLEEQIEVSRGLQTQVTFQQDRLLKKEKIAGLDREYQKQAKTIKENLVPLLGAEIDRIVESEKMKNLYALTAGAHGSRFLDKQPMSLPRGYTGGYVQAAAELILKDARMRQKQIKKAAEKAAATPGPAGPPKPKGNFRNVPYPGA